MPRIGQNPMKWVAGVHQPERITVCTIVFIPSLDGYWEQSLDVLKLCLNSLFENTETPFDLMVFDNGSCEEVQDYLLSLRRQDQIDYFILSTHNIGKVGAWNFLFQAAPGEIVAYADSDVLFLPGWLERSLEVLDAFPEAGMITAQPSRWDERYCTATLNAAQKDSKLTTRRGNLIPKEFSLLQAKGLGKSIDEYLDAFKHEDVLLTREETSAYVGASHFQFLTRKATLQGIIPFQSLTPVGGDEEQLDSRLERGGSWRLSTTDYLVHHLGNRLIEGDKVLRQLIMQESVRGVIENKREKTKKRSSPGNRLVRLPLVRKTLKRINALTYRLLYDR